jgi:hypothetical protein
MKPFNWLFKQETQGVGGLVLMYLDKDISYLQLKQKRRDFNPL